MKAPWWIKIDSLRTTDKGTKYHIRAHVRWFAWPYVVLCLLFGRQP